MSDQYKISLPDGSVREMPAGSTPADVAAAIGPGLAKAALAARIDGELVDLTLPFSGDASLALVTAREEADLERKLLGATAPGAQTRALRNVTLEMIEAAPSYEERASLVRNFVKQDSARAALVVRQLVQERADG